MEVLCKLSEITAPAHQTAEWWYHVTGANVRGISPEPWAHKPRPRSSSARSRTSSPNLRPRRSSVSPPPRRLSQCFNVHSHAKPNDEISMAELWATCAGKGDPYFSCHPPSAPIEVLVFGAPPTLPVVHTLPRRDSKAVWPRTEQDTGELMWLTPRVLRGPPRAQLPRSSRTRAKAEGGRPLRAVRRLLRDLISALPLLSPAEEQQHGTEAGAEVLVAPSVDASNSAQAVPPAPPPPATRSVAVQAQSLTKHLDKGIMGSQCQSETKIVSADGAGEKRVRSPDAWVGGARALRDSHVRLVLRQLRHIERLNRALDHAAPPLKHKQ